MCISPQKSFLQNEKMSIVHGHFKVSLAPSCNIFNCIANVFRIYTDEDHKEKLKLISCNRCYQ